MFHRHAHDPTPFKTPASAIMASADISMARSATLTSDGSEDGRIGARKEIVA